MFEPRSHHDESMEQNKGIGLKLENILIKNNILWKYINNATVCGGLTARAHTTNARATANTRFVNKFSSAAGKKSVKCKNE